MGWITKQNQFSPDFKEHAGFERKVRVQKGSSLDWAE